jgi:hypothetical protein
VAKINLEKVENFRLRKVTVNPPAFTMHFTTNSPQNYHPEHHVFPKTPVKTPIHHAGKNSAGLMSRVRFIIGRPGACIAVN